MFKKLAMATLIATVALPTTAFAGGQDYDHSSQWQREQAERDSSYNNGNRRYRDNDRRYSNNRRYSQDCRRSSGTTGTVAGGVGGAVLGNVLGGGVLGTVAGGVGGALVGRTLDKNHDRAQNRRNGC